MSELVSGLRPTGTPPLRFFGAFEALHTLDLPEMEVGDLYEGYGAELYDFVSQHDEYDVARHVANARRLPGAALELACGNGRLTLPLARAGVSVAGVDTSADMLTVLRRRLEREPSDVRALVRAHQQDMTALRLGERFEYVFLGALTLCVLHDPRSRVALFRGVNEHLADGGTFCFDYLRTSPEALREQDDRVLAVTAVRGPTKRYTLIGRRYYPDEHVQVVNFFSEAVSEDGSTRRFLNSTSKWVVDAELVREELEAAGLRVVADDPLLTVPGPAEETIRLVTCTRPGS